MPTYGYQCTGCSNAFEVVQKITDDPLVKCDSCGGELRKKIFPVGIQFKGSGFYVNDYSGSGGKKESDTPTTADTSKAPNSETTSGVNESATPAATTEAKPAATAAPAPAVPSVGTSS